MLKFILYLETREIIMKNIIFLFVCFQFCFSSVFSASSESEKILAEVTHRMDAVPLPDGYSIFGKPIIDTVKFDTDHLGTDGVAAFDLSTDLIHIFKKPLKSSSFIWGDEYYSVEEYMRLYKSLVNTLYNLTPDTVVFFEDMFEFGKICGIQIPGLDIKTPISKARSDLFKVLSQWRVYGRASKTDALEAIRIERERLEAIAAEEAAKRKAEAEAKAAEEAARIAAIAAAESAKLEFARKASETGVRRRYVPRTQNTGDHPEATVNDPLIPRYPRSSY
jgi:hypothetical protein